MDKNLIESALKGIRETSPKKNFKQSIDLIINLKGLDLKKPDHQVNLPIVLHYPTGKKISICAFVDNDLEQKAKEACDEVVTVDKFQKYKGKQEIKKLANKHNFFLAQASIMPKVATSFGRFLGPKGKMPNPKMGAVLAPNSNIKDIYQKFTRTILAVTKNEPTIKCRVGNEDSKDSELIDNILNVYNTVVHKLPNDINNVKSVMLKLTMGPAVKVEKESTDSASNQSKKGVSKSNQNKHPKEHSKENQKKHQKESQQKPAETDNSSENQPKKESKGEDI
jgi:large subunit ribosomal protein L1